MFSFGFFSQLMARTPPILNEQGKPLDGSIAELTKLDLNDRKQWISIRGENADNPVLLFLAGGPSGTQMVALEKHFVVVNWNQPSLGKSYHAMIGTGQMVDFLQTELMDYNKAMEIAQDKGNSDKYTS